MQLHIVVIKQVLFEWDEEKNKTNILKHGFDFDIAPIVFCSDSKRTVETKYSGTDKNRYMDISKIDNNVVTMVYTIKPYSIRVFSLRKSSRRERMLLNEI